MDLVVVTSDIVPWSEGGGARSHYLTSSIAFGSEVWSTQSHRGYSQADQGTGKESGRHVGAAVERTDEAERASKMVH